MSSRIADTFARLRAAHLPGLVTYTTAGDPDLPESAEILVALERGGADVLEVGVPFSDPLADGPAIQRATERALSAGSTLRTTLTMIGHVRSRVKAPIVIFSYANPLLRLGIREFAMRAADAGVDGVLALDLPIEEADEFRGALASNGLDTIFLLSPTTTEERIEKAARLGSGFLYGISRLGVTGARAEAPEGLERQVARIRALTGLPVAVGFGIATPAQAGAAARHADGVVVGSALMDALSRGGVEAMERLTRELAAAVHA